MRIENMQVDADKIAEGIYEIILERGQEAIVAFGMLPADLMRMVEQNARRKVIEVTAAFYELPPELFEPMVDESKLKPIVQKIVHEVSVAIYRQAKKHGMMIV